MNGSNRSRTRVDRAALAATFAAAILTVGMSAVAMQPAPALIGAGELAVVVDDDAGSTRRTPCADVEPASSESKPAAAGN